MKKSLIAVICGFTITLIVFIAISSIYTRQINSIQRQLLDVDHFSHTIQTHKDYIEELFNEKKWYDSIAQHQQAVQYANAVNHKNINNHTASTFNHNRSLGKLLLKELKQMESLEKLIIFHIANIGYKEAGHIGQMRQIIHQIEKNHPSFEEKILSLRRHEKDYLMRNDSYYAALLHKEIYQWKKQADFPHQLNSYLRHFDAIRFSMKQLGFNAQESLAQDWTLSMSKIQTALRENRADLIKDSYQLTKESQSTQIYLGIFSITLLLVGSYYIVRNISLQVNRLQHSMSEFITSNYQFGENIPYQLPKNEIGQISIHFLKMARKIKGDVKLLEDRVERRTLALASKNILLEQQHSEIMDSLKYAQKLQQSLFVSQKQLHNTFGHAYIHYKPKNMVGGDFYWMKTYEMNGEKHILFAIADCTGHGVPGALLSVLGMNTLDELFASGVRKPNELLYHLRQLILRRFYSDEQRMDGMDIAVFDLNVSNQQLGFAGAQMPLWIVRGNTLIELNGERVPIGFTYCNHSKFELKTISLQADDKLFLFTDGLVDQFGLVSNKKMGKKQLRFTFENARTTTTQKLFDQIKNQHEYWKGTSEQTDDCTFILLEPTFSQNQSTERINDEAILFS